MGMSMHVVGVVPPDGEWEKMKAAHDACLAAGVEIPEEILSFFEWQEPDPKGLSVKIDQHVSGYNTESCQGFDVAIKDLPKNVKVVRFYCNW